MNLSEHQSAERVENSEGFRPIKIQPSQSGDTRRRSPAGFTVLEIMVVVTLIGLLAVIAIPNYIDARKESAKNACINNIKEISYATEQWALEMRKNANATVTFDDIQPYLKGAIICPAGGKKFDDSYAITIVANEPTCQRQPQDHYWLGSTAVANLQNNQTPTTAPAIVSGLIGNTSGNSNNNGKGNGQGGGKGKGKGTLK